MSSSPPAARSKMMVLLFLSPPSGQLFFFGRAGACSKDGCSRGIRKMDSTLSLLYKVFFCFKAIFFPGIEIWNPAFDVAPAELITGGLITELGVLQPPLNSEYVRRISTLVCVKYNNFHISHSLQGEPQQAQRERRSEMKGREREKIRTEGSVMFVGYCVCPRDNPEGDSSSNNNIGGSIHSIAFFHHTIHVHTD